MMTMPEMAADQLGKLLAEDVRRLFGSAQQEHAERLDGSAGATPSTTTSNTPSW
jgi:hypothetical protein